jgi:hypothetical protein
MMRSCQQQESDLQLSEKYAQGTASVYVHGREQLSVLIIVQTTLIKSSETTIKSNHFLKHIWYGQVIFKPQSAEK